MKKDLTRAECFALSITQWCVKEVSGDTSTPVFFTEITSSSKPSLSKHKKYFNPGIGGKGISHQIRKGVDIIGPPGHDDSIGAGNHNAGDICLQRGRVHE